MTIVPVFLEWEGRSLAGAVTLPDGEPAGLVAILPGIGADDAFGSTFAGRLAARLADEGLASVRFDYTGIGDSGGLVPAWSREQLESLLGQSRQAVDTTMAVLGTERFASVGVCYGCAPALDLLSDERSTAAVCLAAPVGGFGTWSRTRKRLQRRRLLRPLLVLARVRVVKRTMVKVARRLLLERKPNPITLRSLALLDRTRITYLYGSSGGLADNFSQQAVRALERAAQKQPADLRARFRVERLPTGPLTMFAVLSDEQQELILATVLDAVAAGFGLAPRDPASEARLTPV